MNLILSEEVGLGLFLEGSGGLLNFLSYIEALRALRHFASLPSQRRILFLQLGINKVRKVLLLVQDVRA